MKSKPAIINMELDGDELNQKPGVYKIGGQDRYVDFRKLVKLEQIDQIDLLRYRAEFSTGEVWVLNHHEYIDFERLMWSDKIRSLVVY